MIRYIRFYGIETFLDDDARYWLTKHNIPFKNAEPKGCKGIPFPKKPMFDLNDILLYTKDHEVFSDKDYLQKENIVKMVKTLSMN